MKQCYSTTHERDRRRVTGEERLKSKYLLPRNTNYFQDKEAHLLDLI
jgi:hypothetical protein